MSLCACGCGQATRIATKTCRSSGRVKDQPMRFVNGHNWRGQPDTRDRTGERNGFWAGDSVGRDGAHAWLTKHYGHDKTACDECGKRTKWLDWAYRYENGGWERDRSAYRVLCRSCHRYFDAAKPGAILRERNPLGQFA